MRFKHGWMTRVGGRRQRGSMACMLAHRCGPLGQAKQEARKLEGSLNQSRDMGPKDHAALPCPLCDDYEVTPPSRTNLLMAHRRAKAAINNKWGSSYLHEVIPSAMETQRAGAVPTADRSLWNSRVSPIGLVSRTRRFMAFSDQFRFTVIRSITSNTFLKSWVVHTSVPSRLKAPAPPLYCAA